MVTEVPTQNHGDGWILPFFSPLSFPLSQICDLWYWKLQVIFDIKSSLKSPYSWLECDLSPPLSLLYIKYWCPVGLKRVWLFNLVLLSFTESSSLNCQLQWIPKVTWSYKVFRNIHKKYLTTSASYSKLCLKHTEHIDRQWTSTLYLSDLWVVSCGSKSRHILQVVS